MSTDWATRVLDDYKHLGIVRTPATRVQAPPRIRPAGHDRARDRRLRRPRRAAGGRCRPGRRQAPSVSTALAASALLIALIAWHLAADARMNALISLYGG